MAIVFMMSRADEQRARWDAGEPVLMEVTAVGDSSSQVTQYGTSRNWSMRTRDLERTGSAVVGTQMQSRLTGECRCELILQEPARVPIWPIALMALVAAMAVPGLLARRRWKQIDSVLAAPSLTVGLEPVWLRRPTGGSRWAARVVPIGPDQTERSAGKQMVVELAGTPASWFPSDASPVRVYGPDPRSGLTVFESEAGLAVGSSAARTGPSVGSRILPWSADLARATGLVPPTEPRPVDVGGAAYQRVSVDRGDGGGRPGDMVLRSEESRKRQGLAAVCVYAVWILAYQLLQPSLPWAIAGLVATVAVLAVLRRGVAARLAGAQPFASWSDRRAARDAALAAAMLGFIPPTLAATWPATASEVSGP